MAPPRARLVTSSTADLHALGSRLLGESSAELRRLRAVRGAHARTARRVRRAVALLALGASLLGVPITSFAAPPSFFSGFGEDGRNPSFADIDGDGDFDAFVGDPHGRTIFFENTGNAAAPVFGDPVTLPFGLVDVGGSASPAFADIDGDGDVDAFIGNSGGSILFFRNTGTVSSPAFAAPENDAFGLTTVSGNAAPTFADVNKDGDLDALVGNELGEIIYFRNSGSASAPAFAPPETNPFGLTGVVRRAKPAVVDIDADGDLDVLVGEWLGNWFYFENTKSSGLPSFLPPETNPFGLVDVGYFSAPALADIDGDGDLDAFVGREDHVALLFGNTGNASVPAFDSSSPATQPFGLPDFEYDSVLAFVDIDGDGDLDAFVAQYEGRIFFFQNGGSPETPQFGGGNPFGFGAQAYRSHLATADIDGDGDLDAFVGGLYDGETIFYENTGSETAAAFAVPKRNAFGLRYDTFQFVVPAFADIDGDGDLDGMFGDHNGEILFFENSGSSTAPEFAPGEPNPFGIPDVGNWSVPAFVDIDDDGDLDAIVGDRSGGSTLFANTGTASAPAFSVAPGALLPDVDRGAAPAFGDVDDDGDLDAFVGEDEGDTYFSENTGSASAPAFAPLQVNPFGLVELGYYAAPSVADIDGDGDLDVFVGAEYGLVVFFENTGTSSVPALTLGSSNPYLLPTVPYYAGPSFGDIDGDGDFDALVGQSDGNLVFFENTGSAFAAAFAAPETNPFGLVAVGDDDTRPALADIDGDGDLDAIIGSNEGDTVFFENTGSATAPAFAAPETNPFGLTGVDFDAAPSLADVDEDGDLDLFLGDHPGNVNYFENTGSATAPAFVSPPNPSPFGLREIVYKHSNPNFVDIDGDGDLDFLSGAYFGETVFSRNGISGGPGTGAIPFMDYEIKESNRSAPNGVLPIGCAVTFTDPVFDFGDGKSDAENYEVSLARTLGLPADTGAPDGVDLEGTHLLGFRVRAAAKGALPVFAGKFPRARAHAKRSGVLVTIPDPDVHDGSGANTIRLDTKKVTRVLIPANASPTGVPSEPSDPGDRYKCYQVKTSSKDGVGTLQDSQGSVRRGLQMLVEDGFGDGQGHPTYGDARLFDLRGVTELCNPVAQANVDTVEQDAKGSTRSTTCVVESEPIHRPATSLLCWRTGLAVAEIPQPWDFVTPGTFIAPQQEKHTKHALGTANPVYVGHSLPAPDRVDTSKETQLCFPVGIADRGSVKP